MHRLLLKEVDDLRTTLRDLFRPANDHHRMKRLATTLLSIVIATTASQAVTVTVSVQDDHCGLCNGSAVATATGGLPPYTYTWSPAPPSGQGTQQVSGLCAGSYMVEVTDGLGGTAQQTFIVSSIMQLNMANSTELRSDCDNSCSGIAQIQEYQLGGTAPYSYSYPFVQHPTPNVAEFAGMCYGSNVYTVTDANGCTGTVDAYISFSAPSTVFNPLSTTAACGLAANGSILMPSVGSYAAFHVMGMGNGYDHIFEFFQDGPYTLDGLAPSDYSVSLWDPWLGANVYCTFPTTVTITSLPTPCGTISGTAYHDADQDCSFNGFDLKQPYRVITFDPIGFAITDGNGHYQQNVDFGTYGISQTQPANEVQICPAQPVQTATVDAANLTVNTDFANLSTVPHDLSVTLNSTNARPGFGTQVWLTVVNNSAFPSGQVSIALSYDAILLNASNASWNLPVLQPYGSVTYSFIANVPADIGLLGSNLNYGATVTNTASEANTVNNTTFLDVTITGSYDPNDKQGTTSSRLSDTQYFLTQDQWVDYTVRFQNTGSAAAETVVIRDTLDDDLFIPSLEILGASHAFTPSFGGGRELIFTFDNINLPDSTTDLPGSQGFISFRLKPNNDIIVGDLLENTAGIYFDFNPPIITNTTSHVVDFSTQVVALDAQRMQVWPNPTHDILHLTLPGDLHAYRVLAADGREMLPQRTTGGPITPVDVSALPVGPYLLQAVMHDGSQMQTRFIRTNTP